MRAAHLLCISICLVYQEKQMKYLKFPHDRRIPDNLENPQHFAILKNENLPELPDQFSVCSSLNFEYYRDSLTFFVITTENNYRWVSVYIFNDFKRNSIGLWFSTISRNFKGEKYIKLKPWDWSHLCMTIDLANGTALLVMNEVKMEEFRITSSNFIEGKPKSLKNRLLFGDWMVPKSRVVQSENSIANVNIYSRLLKVEEMQMYTSSGACSQTGDYLAWNEMQFKLYGDAKFEELEISFCEKDKTIQFLFGESFSWYSCMYFCPKIQEGRVPLITKKEDIKTLKEWKEKIDNPSRMGIWSSFSDDQTEGMWKDFYSNCNFSSSDIFANGQPNGGRTENCAVIWFGVQGLGDVPCDNGIGDMCVCSYTQKPILKMRGLCKKSYIDTLYTLYQDKTSAFYGLRQTKIEFDDALGKWKMYVIALPTTGLTKTEPGHNLILGKHMWRIFNDSSSCNEGKPYKKYLKLTGCTDEEFTCTDGQCIMMDKRCDQIADCRDESDESNCKIVVRKENYNKKIPPFEKDKKAMVNVSIVFLSINDIREEIRKPNKILNSFN